MKVMFIATDNNSSSGAFLSMTVLNAYLRREFGVETMVILPREGTGTVLLQEYGIPYKLIKSYDWIVAKDTKQNLRFRLKNKIKELLNRKAANKIAKELEEGKFDIVHINTIYNYAGALAAKKVGIPFVWHIREIIDSGQNRKFINPSFSYNLIGQSNLIMAISESVYKNYFKNINCRNMMVVYNGIDEKRFYKKGKQIFDGEKTIISFIGGFNVNKGAFAICDALSYVIKKGIDNIEVWFIGEPTDRFKKHVTSKKIESAVKFWGYQKNVAEILEKSDITISGGKMEAFGRTTAEAMLCGNLVIATDTAGSKELVIDRQTGLSYSFGKVSELAEQIIYALENKDEMRIIARNGQDFIHNNMTAYINAKNIYEAYKRVLYKINR